MEELPTKKNKNRDPNLDFISRIICLQDAAAASERGSENKTRERSGDCVTSDAKV